MDRLYYICLGNIGCLLHSITKREKSEQIFYIFEKSGRYSKNLFDNNGQMPFKRLSLPEKSQLEVSKVYKINLEHSDQNRDKKKKFQLER